jgi:hypothetical protein
MKIVWLVCMQCRNRFQREARLERHNRKQGKHGPFCNNSCAARWAVTLQPNKMEELLAARGQVRAVCGTESMYRSGCRCGECREAHAEKAREYRSTRKSA